jgi:hypothetical protein
VVHIYFLSAVKTGYTRGGVHLMWILKNYKHLLEYNQGPSPHAKTTKHLNFLSNGIIMNRNSGTAYPSRAPDFTPGFN